MSCDTPEAAKVWPEAKDPDDTLDYGINFERECARKWEPWTDFLAGQSIRVYGPGNASGFEFEPSTPGRSGGTPPRWPTLLGGTVNDGSIVWTARALSSASLVRSLIGVPTWSCESSEITIGTVTTLGMKTMADLSGGKNGFDYPISVQAAFTAGKAKTAVCILKVRKAQRVCEA
jgi:hypothetical protein